MAIDRSQYEYLDKLPCWFIGFIADEYTPKFGDFKYQKIAHQTAGYACHSWYLDGLIFKPSDEKYERLAHEVDSTFLGTCISKNYQNLDHIVQYREILRKYGLDCKHSHNNMEEGLYPIDSSFIKEVYGADNPFKDLKSDDLFGFDYCPYLFILGGNCD